MSTRTEERRDLVGSGPGSGRTGIGVRLAAAAIVVALVAVACGGGDDATADTTAVETTAAADTTAADTTAAGDTTAAPETTAAAAAQLGVATTDLGDIVVDGDGRTLYIFTPDEQGASVCNDDCAVAWPPLTGDVAAGDGIDGALVGMAERADGSVQVTYNGWPLYYFGGDGGPGDTEGQGVNDVWFVASPAGEAIG